MIHLRNVFISVFNAENPTYNTSILYSITVPPTYKSTIKRLAIQK